VWIVVNEFNVVSACHVKLAVVFESFLQTRNVPNL